MGIDKGIRWFIIDIRKDGDRIILERNIGCANNLGAFDPTLKHVNAIAFIG